MPLETPEQKKTSKIHTRTLLPSVNPVQNTAKIIYKDGKSELTFYGQSVILRANHAESVN